MVHAGRPRRVGALLAWAVLVAVGGVVTVLVTDDDRGDAYVDAFVAASLADIDADDEVVDAIECFTRAVVDVIGVDALDAAGISPSEFGAAETTLADLGVPVDEATDRAIVARARPCRYPEVVTPAALVAGIESFPVLAGASAPDTTELRLCFQGVVETNPDALAALAASATGTNPDAFGRLIAPAYVTCPEAVVLFVAGTLADDRLALDDAGRACVVAYVAAHHDAVVAAFSELTDAVFASLIDTLIAACPGVPG